MFKLIMHIDYLDPFYKKHGSKKLFGVTWGHKGQIMMFAKNATTPLYYMLYSYNSCTLFSTRPFTKVMRSKVNLGSLGVKRSNFQHTSIELKFGMDDLKTL